jgi:hypothetical protein
VYRQREIFARNMISRLRKLANISENKFLANNKCFTVFLPITVSSSV